MGIMVQRWGHGAGDDGEGGAGLWMCCREIMDPRTAESRWQHSSARSRSPSG